MIPTIYRPRFGLQLRCKQAVNAMMTAYPNLTRRHIVPAEVGLSAIAHFGYFKPKSQALWPDVVQWLEETVPQSNAPTENEAQLVKT